MKKVFENIKLNNINFNNRLIRSATWEGIADIDGSIDDRSYEIYEELAKGGIGGIITGFTSVSSNDYYFEGMMRLSDDKLIPKYKKLVDMIHSYDVPVITQLALGGYFKEINGTLEMLEPDEMSIEDIKEVINLFKEAGIRAKKSGFDGIEIHAAHFFFLSRFISPRLNHRTDEYGGTTENRSRILVDILKELKNVAPKLHITIKINSNDFTIGGLEEDECLEICKILEKKGIDSIEVSGNGTSVAGIKPHINEAYFLDFARKLADEVSIPVVLVGGVRSLDTMEDILNNTKIELISLSRPLLREPDFPNKLEEGIETESKCISCNACYRSECHKCIFRK